MAISYLTNIQTRKIITENVIFHKHFMHFNFSYQGMYNKKTCSVVH